MAKQTPKKRKPLARKKAKPARSPKKSARASFRPLRDKQGRFKAKKKVATPKKQTKPLPKRKASRKHPPSRRKTYIQSSKTGSIPVKGTAKPKKLIRPHKPKGKQTFKAVTARPPEYDVVSGTERMVTIHTALREIAINESRLLVPDSRIRKVEDTHGRKALKKEVAIVKFLTESTLESILYSVSKGLGVVEGLANAKPNVRYTVCLNLTEYGIKLYGSNKGVIARVDGLRSEALHLSKWSTPSGTVEEAKARLEAGLESFLDKKSATTVCIESVTITALYGELGRESGNG